MLLWPVAERNDECMKRTIVLLVAETSVVVAVAGQVSALVHMKTSQPRVVLEMAQKSCLCLQRARSFLEVPPSHQQ